MAERIVHPLEAIEIDEQHRDTLAESIRLAQGAHQTLIKQRAVRQVRKIVVVSLIMEAFVQAALLDRQTRRSLRNLNGPGGRFSGNGSLPVKEQNCARLLFDLRDGARIDNPRRRAPDPGRKQFPAWIRGRMLV